MPTFDRSTDTPRLKKRAEFLRAAGKGRRAPMPGLVLQAFDKPDGGPRVGFTVTKKVGNAVVRNRVRRRLRAAAREILPTLPPHHADLVLIGRAGTIDRPYGQLLADLRRALAKAGMPAGRNGPGTNGA